MKKGNKIYLVQQWDGKGTYCIKEAVIGSYGKVQANIIYTENGETANQRFYVDQIENQENLSQFFVPMEIGAEAVQKFAIEKAKEYIADELSRVTRSYETAIDPEYEYYQGSNGGYALAMKKEVEKFENAKPSFVWYVDYCRERGYSL